MYCFSTSIGAPPADRMQYDGDHRTALPRYAARNAGNSFRSRLDRTVFTLFTTSLGLAFGGRSRRTWRWSASPEHSSTSPLQPITRLAKISADRSIIWSVRTPRRYLVTRTKW